MTLTTRIDIYRRWETALLLKMLHSPAISEEVRAEIRQVLQERGVSEQRELFV